MSVSSHSVNPDDDKEVHDLVLMFQNARIPRGSDAFQSIMGDFQLSDEEGDADENENAFDEVDAGPQVMFEDIATNNVKKTEAASATSQKTTGRSKSLARVHFPEDDETSRIIPKRRHSELPRHHPRIFVKTTPTKPILKHDDIDLGSGRPRVQPT